jgi:Tol biopolymer transport system component
LCRDMRTPVWSPSGNRIVFFGSCDGSEGAGLYMVNPDGSDRRRLVVSSEGSVDTYPSWAPNGRFVAFQRSGDASWAGTIFVVDTAGTEMRRIADGILPSWSPLGDLVAYLWVDSASRFAPSLRAVRPDGTEDNELLRDSLPSALSQPNARWLTGPPVWSADGKWLAFANGFGVWVVRATGSDLRAVVTPRTNNEKTQRVNE